MSEKNSAIELKNLKDKEAIVKEFLMRYLPDIDFEVMIDPSGKYVSLKNKFDDKDYSDRFFEFFDPEKPENSLLRRAEADLENINSNSIPMNFFINKYNDYHSKDAKIQQEEATRGENFKQNQIKSMGQNEAGGTVVAAATVSTQNKTPVSQNPTLIDLSSSLINVAGSFLNNPELSQFSRTSHFSLKSVQKDMSDRKIINELLLQIFKASTSGVETFFTNHPETKPKMLLAEASFEEGYYGKESTVCRRWHHVTPLKAAALTLNNYLVIKLLARIIKDELVTNDEKPRLEAIEQLNEVRNRIAQAKPKNVDAEKKSIAENTQTYADLAEYASPVKAYLKACSNYIKAARSSEDEAELNKLWCRLGICWKELPTYVKREFFKKMAWADDRDFNIEPPDGELRFWEDGPYLVDNTGDLGNGIFRSFVKGDGADLWNGGIGDTLGVIASLPQYVRYDSGAITHLRVVRWKGLEIITDKLQTLETACTLFEVPKMVKKPNG